MIHLDDAPSAHDDNDDDGVDRANETVNDENGQTKAPTKKKRARKQVSTVTLNKGTINSRLDIIQMPDCLNFQLNSIMGETSSSNKLLLNLLQTKMSDLKLTMDDRFWDIKLYDAIDFNVNDEYETTYTDIIELPIKIKTESKHTLRQQMKGYTISNTPMDDDEE